MKSTHFACVKGQMGDWAYFVTVMGFSDVVAYVHYAEEICPNTDLDMMIQREVSTRSKVIAEYLRNNDQRFFGSLIIAAYDGKPQFVPIAFEDAPLLTKLEGKVGILQFDGSEQYYAVDGQHRLAAMKEVMKEGTDRYKADEVSVVVICHSKDAEGMSRARRLFTTVNRYAKRTSPVTNIVMDEDDGVALLTRRLIREHQFFSRRIKVLTKSGDSQPRLATGEAMQAGDFEHLMAIGTFYKCNLALVPNLLEGPFSQKQQVPNYETLESGFDQVKARWDSLIAVIEPWRNLLNQDATLREYRRRDGGHILARPVGIAAFVRACGDALDAGVTPSAVGARATKFADLSAPPWNGVLWNSTSQKMIAGKATEDLGTRLWRFLLGLDENRAQLEADWKAAVDPRQERSDLALPSIPPT
jgi:DNA sulfur modification protein DndB